MLRVLTTGVYCIFSNLDLTCKNSNGVFHHVELMQEEVGERTGCGATKKRAPSVMVSEPQSQILVVFVVGLVQRKSRIFFFFFLLLNRNTQKIVLFKLNNSLSSLRVLIFCNMNVKVKSFNLAFKFTS